jgi:hypothetical protein
VGCTRGEKAGNIALRSLILRGTIAPNECGIIVEWLMFNSCVCQGHAAGPAIAISGDPVRCFSARHRTAIYLMPSFESEKLQPIRNAFIQGGAPA